MPRLVALLLAASCISAQAAPSPAPRGLGHQAPHYVSQRGDEAYMRQGPSYQYKILWVYRHRGYPFLVTASFDVWRRVEAPDGVIGWMNADMLSDRRTVLVTGHGRAQIRESAGSGKVVGLADPGAVAGLKGCTALACRIQGQDIDGWIARNRLWGVGAQEFSQ